MFSSHGTGESAMVSEDSSSDTRATYDPEYVRTLFNRIAGRYDLLNHLLSSGFDILWRKKAVRLLGRSHPRRILDVATGTGDLALELVRLKPQGVVGVDVAPEMLRIAARKAVRKNLGNLLSFQEAPAEQLPFPDKTFDAVTVSFGVRNFSSLEQGLSEMARVLRPGGEVVILEFSRPRVFPIRQLYGLYSRRVLPLIGGWISRHREAYEYLPNTIREFPDGEAFGTILRQAGFADLQITPLTFGIVTIYHARTGTDEEA